MTNNVTVTNNFKIEPCYLVRDRISVDRGVTYHRRDISNEVLEDGSEQATWETDRHYKNRAETKAANAIYMKARNRIRQVCLVTDIGFVCPLWKQSELDLAVAEAKALIDDFNSTAKVCHISFLVVCTRLDNDNTEGVSLIQDTLVRSTELIKTALTNFDPKAAKESLTLTKQMIDVLADPATKAELTKVRAEASELCKEINKLVKEFDGNVQNAIASSQGQNLLRRADADWNF